ncbi:MAG: SGNH/GDSL hydrolase family protein [Alphaproteobacteria bacterium]|jgi:hypothetical protein|nr:SGNH/GDSL hydrolase family protein [Alphaproteobacteria bacterium]MDP6622828.1 SGNH/GDSL hydrolase family protein [Alphaproteobacteria bacterium]
MTRANLATLLITITLTLAAAEIGLRLAGLSFPEFNRLDARLGWAPRPDLDGSYATEGLSEIAINAAGFRDDDHARNKPAGVLRLAVLGDSFAEGREVALEKVFWKRLESDLAACLARPVEVLGFAVNGYGTAQELLVLEHTALAYQPDLVLLAFFSGNDVQNNERRLDGHPDRPYFVLQDGALLLDASNNQGFRFAAKTHWTNLKHGLFNALRMLQLGRQGYRRLKGFFKYRDHDLAGQLAAGLDPRVYQPPTDAVWRQAWAVTEALIAEMRDKSAAAGASFWLTTLSNPAQVHPDMALRRRLVDQLGIEDLDYPDRRLAAWAVTQNIPVVTLVDGLRARAQRQNLHPHGHAGFAGGHWNETGHQWAAEILTKRLCQASGG